jgi:hypothetical protein
MNEWENSFNGQYDMSLILIAGTLILIPLRCRQLGGLQPISWSRSLHTQTINFTDLAVVKVFTLVVWGVPGII